MHGHGPSADAISVKQTLDLLDGPFSAVAAAVAEDRYALWLGSGISRSRMPPVAGLVEKVLTYLQSNCDPINPDCRFRHSLEKIVALSGPSATELQDIDFARPPHEWPPVNAIVQRLTLQYARMMDMAPDEEPVDFLVWTALDVRGVYGNAAAVPATEHLSVAALALEGVASVLATANWDGLVEKAILELAGSSDAVRVVVRPEDLRGAEPLANLYKFHGCAVLASADPDSYRDRIIGRWSQIVGWSARRENAAVAARLVDAAATKPTLMLGLSAQDANIQGIFSAAEARMTWPWPVTPAACVFCEEALGPDQQVLLQNVYRTSISPANGAAIRASAHVRAFAKSFLPALWYHVLASKLTALTLRATPTLSQAERDELTRGILNLRDQAASACQPDHQEAFVRKSIWTLRRALSLFRTGQEPSRGGPQYEALTASPIQRIAVDPSITTTGMPELGVAAGLLGLSAQAGAWQLRLSDDTAAIAGAICIVAAGRETEMLFAANAQVAAQLFSEGKVSDEGQSILVHCHPIPSRSARSPKRPLGRLGVGKLREVSISELLQQNQSTAALVAGFRERVAI
jgi:hypothetical protein